ncbi:MAG: two-component system LytT family response regulator [Flavobacteriales bacterium]|jgi:two-component system LytT family response regulator
MMNCVVVDDEQVSRMAVEKCVLNTPHLNLVASYSSATEFSKHVGDEPIDLIFLDVEMPGMSGMEFVKAYRNIPQVIFVTSKTSYAFDAYQYDVTDYIEKPIDYTRFNHAIEKAIQIKHSLVEQPQDGQMVYLKTGSQLIKINLNELQFVEALGDYINIYTDNGRHTLLSTMKAILVKIEPFHFTRIHKSYIVNMNRVQKISGSKVILANRELPIGRVFKQNLKKQLLQL